MTIPQSMRDLIERVSGDEAKPECNHFRAGEVIGYGFPCRHHAGHDEHERKKRNQAHSGPMTTIAPPRTAATTAARSVGSSMEP